MKKLYKNAAILSFILTIGLGGLSILALHRACKIKKALTMIGGADGPISIFFAETSNKPECFINSTLLYTMTGVFFLLTLLLIVLHKKAK